MLGFDSASQRERGARFAGNWIFGAGSSSSQRRRLMSVLRMAHRVLGFDRKNLGIGSLGFGGRARPALLSSTSSAGVIGGLAVIAALSSATPRLCSGSRARRRNGGKRFRHRYRIGLAGMGL